MNQKKSKVTEKTSTPLARFSHFFIKVFFLILSCTRVMGNPLEPLTIGEIYLKFAKAAILQILNDEAQNRNEILPPLISFLPFLSPRGKTLNSNQLLQELNQNISNIQQMTLTEYFMELFQINQTGINVDENQTNLLIEKSLCLINQSLGMNPPNFYWHLNENFDKYKLEMGELILTISIINKSPSPQGLLIMTTCAHRLLIITHFLEFPVAFRRFREQAEDETNNANRKHEFTTRRQEREKNMSLFSCLLEILNNYQELRQALNQDTSSAPDFNKDPVLNLIRTRFQNSSVRSNPNSRQSPLNYTDTLILMLTNLDTAITALHSHTTNNRRLSMFRLFWILINYQIEVPDIEISDDDTYLISQELSDILDSCNDILHITELNIYPGASDVFNLPLQLAISIFTLFYQSVNLPEERTYLNNLLQAYSEWLTSIDPERVSALQSIHSTYDEETLESASPAGIEPLHNLPSYSRADMPGDSIEPEKDTDPKNQEKEDTQKSDDSRLSGLSFPLSPEQPDDNRLDEIPVTPLSLTGNQPGSDETGEYTEDKDLQTSNAPDTDNILTSDSPPFINDEVVSVVPEEGTLDSLPPATSRSSQDENYSMDCVIATQPQAIPFASFIISPHSTNITEPNETEEESRWPHCQFCLPCFRKHDHASSR